MAEENKYVIGGYYTDENGIISCWMGEEIAGISDEEAYLQGLESAIQFLIEDANVDNECITLISNKKDLVDWINGNENTWDNRFLRNKACEKRQVFKGVEILYKQNNEFKATSQWEELAKSGENRRIKWMGRH
ncbi:hypothetical protein PIB30_064767 [Stylosanthes scabra]|uniref:RNase H type-1 domain-containing protein n=1 Tax=Stylosanthes scabra TaxID=79078 RepID=A0ABU6XK34_9FABA|nr:hypothetical protein [Stylosanthes scabra]